MSVLFSVIAFFGLIITAISGVVWIIGRLRHKATKARAVCIVAALVTVISFVAFGVTYEPVERAEELPAVEATEPAESDVQGPAETPEITMPPTTTPEPEKVPEATQTPTEPPASEEPEQTAPSVPTPTPTPEPAEEIDPVEQAKQDIEEAAREIIADNFTATDVDRVTVNEDYGTDADGDYILLVYLTWNVQNSADMTKKVLAMYSEDFSARIGESLENVREVTLFWTVPYHSETGTAVKYSYERDGTGMYQTDSVINIK